jgi:hypothetical protein
MLRYARFAFVVALAAIPGISIALDPHPTQTKQETKDDTKKKAEAVKKDSAPKENDERIDRRNSRMKERNQEIDRMLNKPKK